MKKKIKILFSLVLTILLLSNLFFLGCKKTEPPAATATLTAASNDPPVLGPLLPPVDNVPDGHLRIYYMGEVTDGQVPGMHMWNGIMPVHMGDWRTSAPGTRFDQKDDRGLYTDVQLVSMDANVQFLILKNTFEGTGWGDPQKDASGDRAYSLAASWNSIYIWPDDSRTYICSNRHLPKAVSSAEILNYTTLIVNTVGLTGEQNISDFDLIDRNNNRVNITSINRNSPNSYTFNISHIDPDTQAPLKLTYNPNMISTSANIGVKYIDYRFAYSGNDLGATYNPQNRGATFKVWLPLAIEVNLIIYDRNNSSRRLGSFPMTKGNIESDKAVWQKTLLPSEITSAAVSDLDGYYYQYEINNGNGPKLALDPYAKSMAASRNPRFDIDEAAWVGKGAIVNLANTITVNGLSSIPGFDNRLDAIIYEVHIRDFTSWWGVDGSGQTSVNTGGLASANLTRPAVPLGTYTAFIAHLDYIKEMGYTHIQLLPIMKFRNGDELNKTLSTSLETHISASNYNWGYDPHSFFSPSGMYSQNAEDASLRINELKEVINAIHARGMGVILDNVYNHTADTEIWHRLVPSYYLYTRAGGSYIDAYGGGKVATSRDMVRKLVVDSIKYWFEEFKIDGMRWDLMGEIDTLTVIESYNEILKICPHAIFVGEGWRTGNSIDNAELRPADQDYMNKMDVMVNNTNFGGPSAFSDNFRNILKSGFGNEGSPRFITGGNVNIENLFNEIKAQPDNFNRAADSTPPLRTAGNPGQVLQYIEAHDNMTVFDIISWHTKTDPRRSSYDTQQAFDASVDTIYRRMMLGNFMTLTSQGVVFMHAGQELGRTKIYGDGRTRPDDKGQEVEFSNGQIAWYIHDSYNSSDRINQIPWGNLTDGHPGNRLAKYTKGLIELRKSDVAFRMRTSAEIDSNIVKIDFIDENRTDQVLGYKIAANGATYYIFVNADTRVPSRSVNPGINLTNAQVLVDRDTAGITPIINPAGVRITSSLVTLDALTATVIKTTP